MIYRYKKIKITMMRIPSIDTQQYKDLVDFICLLRYKTENPKPDSISFLTREKIKAIVGYSTTTITKLC